MENGKMTTLPRARKAAPILRASASDTCLESGVISDIVREISEISSEVKKCTVRIKKLEKAVDELNGGRSDQNSSSKLDFLTNLLRIRRWRGQRQSRKGRTFFRRRKSSDSKLPDLLNYKTDLSTIKKDELYSIVPKLVVACCELIEEKSKDRVLGGLYRVPGDFAQIKRLRHKTTFEDNYTCLEEVDNIHTLAGLIKLFFRDVDPPLIRSNEIEQFPGLDRKTWMLILSCRYYLAICQPRAKVKSLQRFLRTLSHEYRETLRYFVCHLKKMCTDYPLSLSSQSIAISIGPSILQLTAEYRGNIQERLEEYGTLNEYLHFMIDYCDEIFCHNFTY